MEKIPLVIMGGYDDEEKKLPKGTHMLDKVVEVAHKELTSGKKQEFINHHFWRNGTDYKDFLKSNFLFNGIPLCWYQFEAGLSSKNIGDVIFFSNDIGKACMDMYVEANQYRIKDKGVDFVFIHEGEPHQWDIMRTINMTLGELGRRGYDRLVLTPADLPFANNFDVVAGRDLNGEDIVYDLNSKGKIYGMDEEDPHPGPFPRFYHFSVLVEEDGKWVKRKVKESQAFQTKIRPLELTAQAGYEARKIDGGGWVGFLKKSVLKPSMIAQTIGTIAIYQPGFVASFLKDYMTQVNNGTNWKNGWRHVDFENLAPRIDLASKLIGKAFGLTGRLVVENENPGLLEDVDSAQDLYQLETVLQVGGSAVVPQMDALEEAATYGMKRLRKLPFFENYENMINTFCSRVGIPNMYKGTDMVEGVFPQYTPEMIDDCVAAHRKYNQKISGNKA